MSLLIENTEKVFDVESIKKGFLICAKHKCWKEPKTGIVSAVNTQLIRVLHHPAIANVTSFFEISAKEVAGGMWEIRWSENLQAVDTYIPEGGGNSDT